MPFFVAKRIKKGEHKCDLRSHNKDTGKTKMIPSLIINETVRIESRTEKNIYIPVTETEGTASTPSPGVEYYSYRLRTCL